MFWGPWTRINFVIHSTRSLELYIDTIKQIFTRRYWVLECTGDLTIYYIGNHFSKRPSEDLRSYRVNEHLGNRNFMYSKFWSNKMSCTRFANTILMITGTRPTIDMSKFKTMDPFGKLMWICFGSLNIRMSDKFKQSKHFIDLCVMGLMKQVNFFF